MIYLSIALVLIFVLYLIDKHHAWKGAAKLSGVFLVLCVLGVAGIYGWAQYEEWKVKKKREADVTACMKTVTEGAIVFVRTGDEISNVVKSFCESHPGANLACGIKTNSDGNLATYDIGDTDKGSPGKVCTAKGWGRDPMLVSTCGKWEAEHPLGSPVDVSSFGNANEVGWNPPEGCSGPLEDAYSAKLTQYSKEHPKTH